MRVCGGFSAPVALQAYLRVFDAEDALSNFEAFASLNGPMFYKLPPNESQITVIKESVPGPERLMIGEIVPLFCECTSRLVNIVETDRSAPFAERTVFGSCQASVTARATAVSPQDSRSD